MVDERKRRTLGALGALALGTGTLGVSGSTVAQTHHHGTDAIRLARIETNEPVPAGETLTVTVRCENPTDRRLTGQLWLAISSPYGPALQDRTRVELGARERAEFTLQFDTLDRDTDQEIGYYVFLTAAQASGDALVTG